MANEKTTNGAEKDPGAFDYNNPADVLARYGACPPMSQPDKVQAYHDKIIADAQVAEGKVPTLPDRVRFGVFADNPCKFVVMSECVGGHLKGAEITYREIMAYHDKEHTRPHVGKTKANADRLVAEGHIRPLVLIGA